MTATAHVAEGTLACSEEAGGARDGSRSARAGARARQRRRSSICCAVRAAGLQVEATAAAQTRAAALLAAVQAPTQPA